MHKKSAKLQCTRSFKDSFKIWNFPLKFLQEIFKKVFRGIAFKKVAYISLENSQTIIFTKSSPASFQYFARNSLSKSCIDSSGNSSTNVFGNFLSLFRNSSRIFSRQFSKNVSRKHFINFLKNTSWNLSEITLAASNGKSFTEEIRNFYKNFSKISLRKIFKDCFINYYIHFHIIWIFLQIQFGFFFSKKNPPRILSEITLSNLFTNTLRFFFSKKKSSAYSFRNYSWNSF